MLELQTLTGRVPFGPVGDPGACTPWNPPVSAFNFQWLKGDFAPAQRDRLAKVTGAIQTANSEVEKLRAAFVVPKPRGIKAPNGNILLSGSDHALALTNRTAAQDQLVRDIVALREPLDKIILPTLRDMSRAAFTADTLRQRIFDKISCLARAGITGLKAPELAAYKASIMSTYRDVSPNELNRLIQAAIDDGSGDSLALLDCLRMLNFSRPKDQRGGDNARLLSLASVPEFTEAAVLLTEVQSANNQAVMLWSQFNGHTSRVNLMKIAVGASKLSTADPTDPYSDFK